MKMKVVGASVAILSVVTLLGSAGLTEAATTESIALSAGRFNYARDDPETEFGVELRFSPRKWKIAPMTGVAGTNEGVVYIYGGLRRESPLDSKWSVTPSFAVALYDEGDGHDLGGPIEFRSAIEISRLIGQKSRLGLEIYHLSNASIYKHNPGSNSIILTVSLPFSHR